MDIDHDDMLASLMDFEEEPEKIKRNDVQRAPYGYIGGKFRSLSQLNHYIPVRKSWIDHFTGSGIVTLNRPESDLEVMNDRWSGIVAFYRCLQHKDTKQQLIDRLDHYTIHSREEFYHCKLMWCQETDLVERAAKWYYMVKCSVAGKGVCFGRVTNTKNHNPIPNTIHLFEPIHHRIRNVIIENLDFEICFKDFDRTTAVHYADPPYIGTDKGLYGGGWNRNEQDRLLRTIERTKGFVALSGYDDEQTNSAKFWTRKHSWEVIIGSEPTAFTDGNNKEHMEGIQKVGKATECLWIKEAG